MEQKIKDRDGLKQTPSRKKENLAKKFQGNFWRYLLRISEILLENAPSTPVRNLPSAFGLRVEGICSGLTTTWTLFFCLLPASPTSLRFPLCPRPDL